MYRWTGLMLLLLSAACAPAADDAAAPAKKLKVQAQAAPVPALRYRLLPPLEEQQTGNAALDYYRAFMPESIYHRREKGIDDKMEAWRKAPLGELPVKEMAWLRKYEPLRQCAQGARKQHCDWDLAARMRANGVATLLPDVQAMRELNRLLALRARLELAEGKLEQAVTTLQTSLALARHVGEAPTIVNGLVGFAGANLTLDVIEEFIQQPDAPNLYWALSELPHPFINMRVCCAGERLMFQGTLPGLEELEDKPLTALETANLMNSIAKVSNLMDPPGQQPNAAVVLAAIAALHPEAKAALLKQGFTEKKLKDMPAAQVVAIYGLREYRRLLDDRLKWVGLPFPQAHEGVLQADRDLKNENSMMAKFVRQVMPAMSGVLLAEARVERRLAALRVIEAIRLHAAANAGKPPARLEDIKLVPVPFDPVLGKPFEYRVHDDHVELTTAPFAGMPKNYSLHYRIELKSK